MCTFRLTLSRRRDELIASREKRCGKEFEDYEGRVLWAAGFLLVFHHVSSRVVRVEVREADECRLLFMTYNGYVMIAVAVGAFLGYVIW
jgi:hypothetical protein